MSVASRIPNVAILGLLISLCLFSDQGFGHVGAAEQIVDTDPHVVLEVGTRGILPCRIQRGGYSVDWKLQLSSETELLVSLDLLFDVGERDGPGYEAGLFNITDDYSLVIKDVKVQDEGLYICAFNDYQTGKVFRNSTIVFVQAFPDEPFPVVQECTGKDVNSGACILATHQTLNLTCVVRGYYPDIDLSFLHGSEKVAPTEYEEWTNVDGTKNKEIQVQISISDEPYECVALGLPGMVEKRSFSVIVQARSPSANVAAIIASVLSVVGISLLAVFSLYMYRRRNNRDGLCTLRRAHPEASSERYSRVAREDGLDEQVVDTLREKLKTRYIEKFGKIKATRAYPQSLPNLQQIFVSLLLILRSGFSRKEKNKHMEIDELYRRIENESEDGCATRFAFFGNVCGGKSTLFSKIALDWATGKCLEDINLLFLESFQEMEDERYFGDIVRNQFPELAEIEAKKIDAYIKENQRKVAILILDLDDTKMDFMVSSPQNAVVSIVRGDIFEKTPVLITTLPYVVDLIKSNDDIRELYTLIEVKGFTEEGTHTYIRWFFQDDTMSSESLIHFMKSNVVVSQLIAPFPVFCLMLCNIWEVESKRDAVKLETTSILSCLLSEICFSLKELYASKYCNCSNLSEFEACMNEATHALKMIGEVALEGLVKNHNAFSEEKFRSCKEFAQTAYEMGILSKEKRLAPREIRQKQGKQYIEEYCFFHQHLQEYLASFFLEMTYNTNPLLFEEILRKFLLVERKKYRHVLFFTAARGGEVGKSLMEALCQRCRVDDISFILEVAFEFQDTHGLAPVMTLLRHRRPFVLDHETKHVFAARIFALETYGKEVIREVTMVTHTQSRLDPTKLSSDGPSNYARALFAMPNLRSLELANSDLQNRHFFKKMAEEARKLQLETLRHKGGNVDSTASSHYAKAIVSMPKLQNLELSYVELSKEFYPKMADGASEAKIVTLKHEGGSLDDTSSSQYGKAIVSMPHLQNLELSEMELSKEFYPKFADGASNSGIMTLKHKGGSLMDAESSSHYAKAIVSLPKLENLELCDVKLSDEFYQPTANIKVSNSEITKLKHVGGNLGSAASANYASFLCSMPNLKSLELDSVKLDDEPFYKTIATEATKSKIEEFRHADANLGPVASGHYGQGLFSMPNLWSLELDKVKLDDEFYKCMAGKASKSKIKRLKHLNADLGHDASHHYAGGLCSMSKLQTLELYNVRLTDEFSVSMADEAPRLKMETLVMKRCTVNRRMLFAMLSLPRLKSLTLGGELDFAADSDDRKRRNLNATSLSELSVDVRNIDSLWKLGVLASCPRVKKLTLLFYEDDQESSNTIRVACTPFQQLTELYIDWLKTLNPAEFCDVLKASCPRLTKLSLSRIKLHNDKATEIIQSLKTQKNLTILELDSCWTDQYLDPLIAEVNSEGKLAVTVKHMN